MNLERLALGTAQFGLRYGIANRSGQVASGEAALILRQARAAGWDTLDTAVAYGDSEARLGEIGVGSWRIVSKLPRCPTPGPSAVSWAETELRGALHRLRVPRLHGLLLHQPRQLLEPGGEELFRALERLKEQGLVEKTGVSVYGPPDLEALTRFRFDLVQAPLNVLDRRMIESGWLARFRQAGVEIHVRSAFLQGLLLMKPGDRPPAFDRWSLLWTRWHRWLEASGTTPLQACLGYVMSQSLVDRVVVGVDSARQFQEILAAAASAAAAPPDDLKSSDEDLINPSRWKSA